MGVSADGELYHDKMIGMLEAIWGEGYLSPGGPDEVARLVGDDDLSGCSILDIGCGAGGIELALATTHRAGYVTGIDVEDTVLNHARGLVAKAGLEDRIGLVKVAPGPRTVPARNLRRGVFQGLHRPYPRQARAHARGLPRTKARRAVYRL